MQYKTIGLVAALVVAYVRLADFTSQWIGRTSVFVHDDDASQHVAVNQSATSTPLHEEANDKRKNPTHHNISYDGRSNRGNTTTLHVMEDPKSNQATHHNISNNATRESLLVSADSNLTHPPIIIRKPSTGTDGKYDDSRRHDIPGNSTTSNQSPSGSRPVTIVVQLSGELGNQLGKIGNGLCIKRLIDTKLGLETEIKLRHQSAHKWKHAMEWTKEVFPIARTWDFTEANTEEFTKVHNTQKAWFKHLKRGHDFMLNSRKSRKALEMFDYDEKKIIGYSHKEYFDHMINILNKTWRMDKSNFSIPDLHGEGNISIPHVYAVSFLSDYCLDLLYDDLRELFTYDQRICKEIPDPDETVFHLRNFLTEMPRRGKGLGFEELDPNRTAIELFANHRPGEKVAIISRYENHIDQYMTALESIRGLKVRHIKGQTGNQDFCFLLRAQKEIIGVSKSSYTYWAGILGEAKRVRIYYIDSESTRGRGFSGAHSYNFSNKELSDRFSYENYKVR